MSFDQFQRISEIARIILSFSFQNFLQSNISFSYLFPTLSTPLYLPLSRLLSTFLPLPFLSLPLPFSPPLSLLFTQIQTFFTSKKKLSSVSPSSSFSFHSNFIDVYKTSLMQATTWLLLSIIIIKNFPLSLTYTLSHTLSHTL